LWGVFGRRSPDSFRGGVFRKDQNFRKDLGFRKDLRRIISSCFSSSLSFLFWVFEELYSLNWGGGRGIFWRGLGFGIYENVENLERMDGIGNGGCWQI